MTKTTEQALRQQQNALPRRKPLYRRRLPCRRLQQMTALRATGISKR